MILLIVTQMSTFQLLSAVVHVKLFYDHIIVSYRAFTLPFMPTRNDTCLSGVFRI